MKRSTATSNCKVRTQLSEEFKKKEGELRRELSKEAAEKAERNSAELQIKLDAQAKELKASRANERALLRTKAELQEQAEKAELEAQRKSSEGARQSSEGRARSGPRGNIGLKTPRRTSNSRILRRQIEDLKRKAEQGYCYQHSAQLMSKVRRPIAKINSRLIRIAEKLQAGHRVYYKALGRLLRRDGSLGQHLPRAAWM